MTPVMTHRRLSIGVVTALILAASPLTATANMLETQRETKPLEEQHQLDQFKTVAQWLNTIEVKNGDKDWTADSVVGITELHFGTSRKRVTDVGLQKLSVLPNLTGMDLSGYSIQAPTDAGIAYLAAMRNLQWLKLQYVAITDQGIAALAGHPKLGDLVLDASKITDASMPVLAGLPALTSLDISSTKITGAGLAALSASKSLRRLVIKGCSGLKAHDLVTLAQMPSLRELIMDINKFGDGIDGLSGTNLESLSLMSSGLTDAGAVHLGEIKGLKTLRVWNNDITDAAMPAIGKLTELETLYLDRTKVTDAGLTALAGNLKLKTLWISTTAAGDAAANTLVKLPSLTFLHMNGTGLTDAGLAKLVAIPSLIELSVRDTKVSAEKVKALVETINVERAKGKKPALVVSVSMPEAPKAAAATATAVSPPGGNNTAAPVGGQGGTPK